MKAFELFIPFGISYAKQNCQIEQLIYINEGAWKNYCSNQKAPLKKSDVWSVSQILGSR